MIGQRPAGAAPVVRAYAEALPIAASAADAVPHDCTDGFGAAFWRRPEAYLDPVVRSGISMLAQTGERALRPGLDRLAADLESGRWHDNYRHLVDREDFDAGYRLLIADAG